MRYKNVIMSAAKNLLMVYAAFALFACDDLKDAVSTAGDKSDNEAALMEMPSITLRGLHNATRDIVNVTIPEGNSITKKMRLTSTMTFNHDSSYLVKDNSSLVEVFNNAHGTTYATFPETHYSLSDSLCVFFSGMRHSTEASLVLRSVDASGKELVPGKYVLPIESSIGDNEKTVLYYVIEIESMSISDVPLYTGDDFFIVFYVNTKDYQPMLASEWYNVKYSSSYEKIWEGSIGNIINLRTVTIGIESVSGRAILNIGPDMRYVLNHFEHYILPLQKQGRKVCLSIEGNRSGLGFCNLTDEQMVDFVSQVTQIVNQYGLDGINLWDRNSGYGKEGMPPVNTTSYPKLIKALKESIGQRRLLTLTDYEEPTEYFYDVDAMGGIKVGEYIDYAWSGYNSKNEPYQIVDPYHQGSLTVSSLHPRKPIAGLDPKRYGCINVTWYPKTPSGTTWNEIWDSESNIIQWVSDGLKQNNIFVYDDLMTSLQNEYEGTWAPEIHFNIDDSLGLPFNEQYSYTGYTHIGELPDGGMGYGKWLKDW